MRKFFYFLLFLVLIAAGLEYLLRTTITKSMLPPKKEDSVNPSEFLFTANDLKFPTTDGVNLHGWLIHGKPGYPAFVLAHDYGSDRSDLLGKLEGLITRLNKEGYFILLFDFRGHGDSDSRSTFGFRESQDLHAAFQAILKYKVIDRRMGVLGVGMGAIAAIRGCQSVDEVKFLILDSVYDNIPERVTNDLLSEWPPFLAFIHPTVTRAVDWNLRDMLHLQSTNLDLQKGVASLYPRPLLFVDHNPLSQNARDLYEAAKEPKEMFQMKETASDDLVGTSREEYNNQLWDKIQKYLPAVKEEQTLEIKH
ncbi:MAG TPA: alpha/beta fold hydrolase [Acidobacteriota bacterium]|nr:alpha/beta fold hydrolase [Acidobacteriota bacterium]